MVSHEMSERRKTKGKSWGNQAKIGFSLFFSNIKHDFVRTMWSHSLRFYYTQEKSSGIVRQVCLKRTIY